VAGRAPLARAAGARPHARGVALETERLTGTRPSHDDRAALAGVVQDPTVTAWLSSRAGAAPQADDLLGRFRRHWDEHGFGPWIFRERATGAPIGYGGPRRTAVDGRDEVEVLYAVASSRWGEGFATEIARASVQTAFGSLGIESLVCFTRTDNVASRRVMDKAGFHYERDFERAGLPHALYRIRRPRDHPGGSRPASASAFA